MVRPTTKRTEGEILHVESIFTSCDLLLIVPRRHFLVAVISVARFVVSFGTFYLMYVHIIMASVR